MAASENDPRGPSRPRWIARAIIFIISQLWSQYTLLNTEWGKHRHGLIIAPDPGTCRNRGALGRLGRLLWAMGSQGKLRSHPKVAVHRADGDWGHGRWLLGSTERPWQGALAGIAGGPWGLGTVLDSLELGSP